jgi:O-antigen ligase
MAILDHSDRPTFLRASVLLIGLAWTLPFLQPYHRYPLTGFYSEWLAFALGLAAALVLLSRHAWRGVELPAVAIAPVGLAVVLGAQAALERVPYPEQVLIAALYLLWASLLVLLGSVLRRALGMTTVATTLAWFLFASGILGAAVGLLQHFEVTTPIEILVGRGSGQQVFGNLGQPNHYAAYITLALASAGYLYACRRLHGALAGGCMALCLLVLALTGSRSTWLFLAALTVLAVLLHARRRDSGTRRLAIAAGWLLPGFVIALAVATLPFMAPPQDRLLTSVERLFQMASGIGPRLQLWSEAWQMFLEAPLFGAGWGQFAWHHFMYQAVTDETAGPGIFHHAHNIVLQLMAETGTAGTLIIVGALVLWLAALKRVTFDLEWWWLLALLAVIGIHSLLEFPLWYSYFLGMAALALGLGAERMFPLRFAGAARAAAGLAIIAGWLNLVAMVPSYVEFERLVFTPESRSAHLLDEAAFAKTVVSLYREPLLVPYVELAVAYGITVSEERLPEKLALTSRVVHFAPEPFVSYRYALLLALAGDREAALSQLNRSLRVYPDATAAVIAELMELARHHPAEFTPLLEWTVASVLSR